MPGRARTAGERRQRRAVGAALLVAWSVLLQGCYESLPVQQGAAPTAARVELVLNDQGRAALGDKLGPGVDKMEGQVIAQDAGSYTLSVFHVRQLNGSSATWTGEQITVAKEYCIGYQVRRLDKFRTAVLAGGITVAVVLVIFGKSLNIGGGGGESAPPPEPPGPQGQLRPPR